MSELDGTASTMVNVVADGCSITLDAYMHDTVEIRAKFNPAYTIHFDHGLIPDKSVPATVTVNIGSASLRLTPEVWAAVNDAVREVLPVGVVPA